MTRKLADDFPQPPFAGSSDIPLLVDWTRVVPAPERVTDYPSIIDLPQLLSLPHNQENTRVWFADTGELLGFAFVDTFHTLRFELDWRRTTRELEAAVVTWGNHCLAKTMDAALSSLLYATSHEDDRIRLAYLERQGFARVADYILHLERSLAGPIASPELPAGFILRPVEGEQEADELARLHREAFGTPHMTTTRRLALMRVLHYDPALDLVVVTAEGVRVAYGMGSVSPRVAKTGLCSR